MTEAAKGGMAEVELGKLAVGKAQNPEVKRFAQQMIADHTRANNELKTLAGKKSVTLPTDVGAEHKATMDKLSKLSGAEFDKEYVRAMVEDHEKDVKEFQTQSATSTDADVKAFAAKTLPTLQSHLTMIKGIQGKMK
jgi:putative membrane protein